MEAYQSPELFSNAAIAMMDPEPAYRWIPEMLDPPEHIRVKQQINGQVPQSVIVTPLAAGTVERNSPCLSLASSRLGRTAFNAAGEARTC
jgi:hypothetical protein